MKQFLLILILLVSVLAFGQNTPFHYRVETAIGNHRMFCLQQDANGRILIGTDNGLYRYNGFNCKRLKMEGVLSNEVLSLERYQQLFFGLNRSGQVLKIDQYSAKAQTLKGVKGEVKRISVLGKELKVSTSNHIYTFQLPKLKLVSQIEIPFTDNKRVFANDFTFFQKKWYSLLNSGELVDLEEEAARSLPNNKGKQLIAFAGQLVIIPGNSKNENLYAYKAGEFKNYGALDQQVNVHVNGAKVIGNQLYVMTEYGVFVYTSKMHKSPAHWFEGIAITDILLDQQGNRWITTKNKGLLFVPVGKHKILSSSTFLSMDYVKGKGIFGADLTGDVVLLDQYGTTRKTFSNPVMGREVQWLDVLPESNLLVTDHCLFSTDNPKLTPIVYLETIKGMAQAADGSWLLAKSSGLICFSSNKLQDFWEKQSDSSKFTVLLKEPILQFKQDPLSKQIACITQSGVYLLNEGGEMKAVLHFGKQIKALHLQWFKEDLFVVTEANQLLQIKGGKVVQVRDFSQSAGDLVIQKLDASTDFLYVLSDKGIYRLSGIKDKVQSLKDIAGFEGLLMRDLAIDDDQLYIATQRGILSYKWEEKSTAITASLLIGQVYGQTKPSIKDGMVVFEPNEQFVIIPTECVDLSGNHPFVMQYRIFKNDENRYWNTVSMNNEQINFSHLEAGTYTVEIRLFDPFSKASTPLETVQFTIKAAWYESHWLWLSVGLILGVVGFYLYKRIRN